jgi:SpoVK/Ycf46/Vps4 family AAA+-type ATPase
MAAEVIANDLRLNLYRVNLAAIVSKYIGETEKNLSRLFDAAERGVGILFFDEADALFGKRTEVKEATTAMRTARSTTSFNNSRHTAGSRSWRRTLRPPRRGGLWLR